LAAGSRLTLAACNYNYKLQEARGMSLLVRQLAALISKTFHDGSVQASHCALIFICFCKLKIYKNGLDMLSLLALHAQLTLTF